VDRIGAAGLSTTSTTSAEGISATGTEPSAPNNVTSTPTPGANATGTGSQDYLARWTDNAGTLGNSTLFQNAGKIGLGTTTPGAKFHVVGTQGSVGAGAFQLDTPVTFGSWSGAYPAFEIVNANLTNNNVSLFSFSDAPSGASHAGMGAVNTSHGNKWGHLFFYSKQSDGYQVRMGIYNGGYVGINTTTPTQRLAVNGNIQVLGGGNGIIFPDGSIQTKATSGTINGTGTTNQITKFTGPNSFGNSAITEINGNVGIGTNAPGAKLEVVSNALTGYAGLFRTDNTDATAATFRAESNGKSGVISGYATGMGGAGHFQIFNSINVRNALTAETNGTGFAAHFTGTGVSSKGVYIQSGPGEKGLEVNKGRIILSYDEVADGGTIPTDVAVVGILNNSVLGRPVVSLPAFADNGTVIIVGTNDPEGAEITGVSGGPHTITTNISRRFIRISGVWKTEL
jgi:hypothetical protein